MSKKLFLLSLLTLLMLVLTLSSGGAAYLAAQSGGAPIRLAAGTFTPARGETLITPPGLTIAGYAAGVRGYYIVQFAGPVQQAWKDAVTATGAELIDYLPDYAFKTRMTSTEATTVDGLADVVWVGLFQPSYKLNPALDRSSSIYEIRIERGAAAGLATAAVMSTGADVLRRDSNVLLVAADSAQVDAIANVVDVAWVDNFRINAKHNESGGGIIMGANTAIASGYDGSTQIAAVADTGIGDGTAAGAHPDIPVSRITAIHDWTAGNAGGCYRVKKDGAQDVDSGHGTHVSVSVLGDGGAGGVGRGNAPAANLVFQAVEEYLDLYAFCAGSPDGYYLIGLPDDLRDLYQQAYDAGARIHSNSWGSDVNGDYTLDSANTDDFIWNNPDVTITFSAGNAGTDGDANGVVDNDSIGSPATAKNVITVGASENDRADNWPCDSSLGYTSHDAYQTGQTCNSMGGNQSGFLGTWGSRYPADFPAPPLFGDSTAGNPEQMASWSSRGPTDDGRIKPDIVAPGTWILSGYSSVYQEGYGDPVNAQNGAYQWDGWGMPRNVDYKHMGGTSMSNPLVAGAATVVRDFYQKTDGHNASAALVKATLINSAADMLDENNDGTDDNDFPIPNVHEGWGRVDLANATDGTHQYVDNAAGINTGTTTTYQFTVDTAGSPFKVSLVWSDFASTEAAATNLVNDLDLEIQAPGGTVYKGNVFSDGWSLSGGSADSINNVENAYVQSAAAGTWTVRVIGSNVPQGPQPYAIVADGDFAPVDNPPVVTLELPAQGATVFGPTLIQIDATDEDAAVTLNVEWNIDGGTWQSTTWDGSRYVATWDTTTVSDGAHVVNARAIDSQAQTGTDSNNVTVDNAPSSDVHVGDLDGSATPAARGGKWNATVTITIHDSGEEAVANATVNGSWSAGANGSGSCVTTASGQCSITRNSIRRNSASVTFTVTSVTHASLAYAPGVNHDPDGDSTGTVIVVNKP
jgi:hypothetical protein